MLNADCIISFSWWWDSYFLFSVIKQSLCHCVCYCVSEPAGLSQLMWDFIILCKLYQHFACWSNVSQGFWMLNMFRDHLNCVSCLTQFSAATFKQLSFLVYKGFELSDNENGPLIFLLKQRCLRNAVIRRNRRSTDVRKTQKQYRVQNVLRDCN